MTLKLIVIASLNRILPLLTVTADAVLSFQIGVSLSFQPLPFFFWLSGVCIYSNRAAFHIHRADGCRGICMHVIPNVELGELRS